LELSTITILKELLWALNTSVDLLLGNKVINPGTGLALESETVDVETKSFRASTMFNTGVVEIVVGARGLETKTRNLSPLGRLPELELELPQELNTAAVIRSAQAAKAFFKTEAPNRLGDGELDARSGIITERSRALRRKKLLVYLTTVEDSASARDADRAILARGEHRCQSRCVISVDASKAMTTTQTSGITHAHKII
jgi:hypothetical protein